MNRTEFEDHIDLEAYPNKGNKLYNELVSSLNKYMSASDLRVVTNKAFFPEKLDNIIDKAIYKEKVHQVLDYSMNNKKLGIFLKEAKGQNPVCLDEVTESLPREFGDHIDLEIYSDKGNKLYGQLVDNLNKYLSGADLRVVTNKAFFPEKLDNIIDRAMHKEKIQQVLDYSINNKKLGIFLKEAKGQNPVCLDEVTEALPHEFEDHIDLEVYPDKGNKLYGQLVDNLNKYLSGADLRVVTNKAFFPEKLDNIIDRAMHKEKIQQVLDYSMNNKKLGIFLTEAKDQSPVCLDEVTESLPQKKKSAILKVDNPGNNNPNSNSFSFWKSKTLLSAIAIILTIPTVSFIWNYIEKQEKQLIEEKYKNYRIEVEKLEGQKQYVAAIKQWRLFLEENPYNNPKKEIVLEKINTLIDKLKRKVKYKMLVIANKDYSDSAWESLTAPIQDAQDFIEVMKEKYGVKEGGSITFIPNANESMINRVFNKFAETITEEDSVIIYYSGHGAVNNRFVYWIPVDGTNEPTTWVSNVTIVDHLEHIAARALHVLLISDSCFSGQFVKGGEPNVENSYFDKYYFDRSCEIIASANGLAVDNYKHTGNSPFARELIETLKKPNGEDLYSSSQVFQKIKENIDSSQKPIYGKVEKPNHERPNQGELFFVKLRE